MSLQPQEWHQSRVSQDVLKLSDDFKVQPALFKFSADFQPEGLINEPRTGGRQTMFSGAFRWRAAGAYLLKIKYVSSMSASCQASTQI